MKLLILLLIMIFLSISIQSNPSEEGLLVDEEYDLENIEKFDFPCCSVQAVSRKASSEISANLLDVEFVKDGERERPTG